MNKLCNIIIVLTILLIGWASLANAQDNQQPCGGSITNIYFGNGVGVSVTSAIASRNALADAYRSELSLKYPDEHFIFGVAYNPDRGLFEDVWEVLLLRDPDYSELGLTSAQLLALLQMSQSKLDELNEAISSRENAPGFEWLQTSVQRSLFDLTARVREAVLEYLSDPDYIEALLSFVETNEGQTQLYRNNLDAGQRVIVVAHSQGNLFANRNVSVVREENGYAHAGSIGIVGVATPAGRLVGGGTYVTAHDDGVINALRVKESEFGYEILPSNIDNDIAIFLDPRDLLNHYFVQSYLQPSLPSREKIDEQLFRLVDELVYPTAEVGNGAIRATLEWGNEPDVDLHVYEPAPDSTHVYYSWKIGLSGELDRDDQYSFGPENYFVECDQLKSGTYQFGVQYYRGSNPENARLQVTTSDGQVSSNNLLLTEAVGGEGDDNPFILITVDVAIDADGKVTYSHLSSPFVPK